MATDFDLPRVPSGLDSLRAGIDAHRQQMDAAKEAGAQVQAEKTPTASPASSTTGSPA